MARRKLTLTVESFPRLHVALIDLGKATRRSYGGVGFVLSDPRVRIRATIASRPTLDDLAELDAGARSDVLNALRRIKRQVGHVDVRIEILHAPPQHVGLGCKTALVVGVVAA